MRTLLQGLFFCALLAQAASFEVATIRINHTGVPGDDQERPHDGLLQMSDVTLRQCVRYAYEISELQIVDGPGWVDEVRFDIVAKSERPYPTDDSELLRMLKPLLAERFHLALHRETRSLPGLALMPAKSGIRAKVSAPGTRFNNTSASGIWRFTGCTMATLAIKLSALLGRPVADLTGDHRSFDISLRWTRDETQFAASGGTSADGPSLFTALQEQIGVKLEARKVPADVLVIDHAEMPSEN